MSDNQHELSGDDKPANVNKTVHIGNGEVKSSTQKYLGDFINAQADIFTDGDRNDDNNNGRYKPSLRVADVNKKNSIKSVVSKSITKENRSDFGNVNAHVDILPNAAIIASSHRE